MLIALHFWLPADLSAHGHQIDYLITFIHYFMAALFIGWGVFFVYCLLRFRQRRGHCATYELIKAKPSKYTEFAVVAIEAFMLLFLSMPVWASYKNEPPKESENPLRIRIYAQQFAWNMQYPGPDGKFGRRKVELVNEQTNPIGLDRDDPNGKDDVTTINMLHIPKGRPVITELSSKDVIHSFSVPLLRIKQDIIPGMSIPVWFTATETGQHDIQCAQLCGLGHYRMRGSVVIQEPAEFEKWYSTAKASEEFIEE